MTSRTYLEQNVYDAAQERLRFVFQNFERIYVSFSGGKDSGVLLNLAIDYARAHPDELRGRKIGIQIMDNEANYTYSAEFMHRILQANQDILEIYWCCLPITLPCTVSSYEIAWQCWGIEDEHRWIRPMPAERIVKCPKGGFTSNRILLESDGMGYSLTKTVVNPGVHHWHYKDHLESCYCVSGYGRLTNKTTGEQFDIEPDTTYVLDKHDDHIFQCLESTVLICVFNPPLTGQ